MELVGSNPNRVTGSLHWQNSDGSEGTFNNNYYLSSGDFSQQFHVYSLLWQHDTVQFFVDDNFAINVKRTKSLLREIIATRLRSVT